MPRKRSTRKQCSARTKSGAQCRNRVFELADKCKRHLELEEQVSDSGGITEPGPNEKALGRTLEAMGVEAEMDAARFQMLRSLARAVDLKPERAALWTEYREALSDLMKDAKDADSGLAEAYEALRGAAEVGDS